MDAFKDLMEAFSQRIRSPIIGSIAIVFVLVNWKPIWYLLFAERPVRQKFLYFEANTDAISLYCIPIGVGVVYAFGLPWVKWAGAWVAQKPYARLHEIQDDQASARRVKEYERAAKEEKAKANFDAIRESALLGAAERRKQASELGEEELSRFVEEQKQPEPLQFEQQPIVDVSPWPDIDQLVSQMPTLDQTVLKLLEEYHPKGIRPKDPFSWFENDELEAVTSQISAAMKQPIPQTRARIDFNTGTGRLSNQSLVEMKDRVSNMTPLYYFELTSKGYAVLDRIRQTTSAS